MEVVGGPFLVSWVEGYEFLGCRVDAHGTGHGRIGLLPRLNARGRMQIERGLQALVVQVFQEGVGIWKEHLVPGVAGPAEQLTRLIGLSRGLELLPVDVPVHVDHQHVEGRVVFAKAADQLIELLVAVGPVTRPPGAEGEARRQRNAAGDADKIAESLPVVVPVAEEVPVGVGAGFLVGGALHGPRPGAFFAIEEAEIGGVEERARGVVNQRPARAGNEAGLDGLFGLRAQRAVQGARGAHQIFRVGEAGMPHHILAVDGEFDGEIFGREVAVACWYIGKSEHVLERRLRIGIDGNGATAYRPVDFKLRHRQPPIDEHKRRVIFKLPVRRPLHADKLRREHCEPRMAGHDHGFGVGDGVVGHRVFRRYSRSQAHAGQIRARRASWPVYDRPSLSLRQGRKAAADQQASNCKCPERNSHGCPHSCSNGKVTTALPAPQTSHRMQEAVMIVPSSARRCVRLEYDGPGYFHLGWRGKRRAVRGAAGYCLVPKIYSKRSKSGVHRDGRPAHGGSRSRESCPLGRHGGDGLH